MINTKFYEKMKSSDASKIEKLRERLAEKKIPKREVDQNLLIATFNIREFGAKRREGFAINALAEICSRFDVVAIQELRSKLGDLKRLLRVMGNHWKVIFNDPAGEPRNKGNDERFAYLYDSRVIGFTGMAAELLVTDDFLGTKGVPKTNVSIPWRTPYMVSFRTSNFDFVLLTVHIQWNSAGGITMRTKEIKKIADWIGKRRKDAKLFDPDMFVLGDFNIPGLKSKTFKALESSGLKIPTAHKSFRSNLKKNAHYDQIAYYTGNSGCDFGKAGRLDVYTPFFSKNMSKKSYDAMTYQISDHYPLWLEAKINQTSLDQFIKQ